MLIKMSVVFPMQIRSGKNNIQLCVRNGKIHKYPSKAFVTWRHEMAASISVQKSKWPTQTKMALPINVPCRMTVSYCELQKVPANQTRDVSGMMDAIQHALEYCGIIENDGLIKAVQWEPALPIANVKLADRICAVVTLEGL